MNFKILFNLTLVFLFFNGRAQVLNVNITSTQNTTCNGICNGMATASATGGTGNYSFVWSNGATGSSVNNLCGGSNFVIVNDGINQDTATFITGQPSQITISLSPPSSICLGSTVSVCANISGGTPPYTFNWAPFTGISNTTTSCPVFSPTVSTTYTLTVADANGCISTNAFTLIVNSVNAIAGNNGPYCTGGNIQLSASGGISYLWSGPNGYTSNLQNPNIPNSNTTMNGIYTVTVTTTSGCTATATTSVNVNNPPTLNPFYNNPLCSGSNLVFNANSNGASSYVWSGPNGFFSTQQNPIILNAQQIASGTYSVTVSSTTGCSTSSTLTVNITSSPTLAINSISEPNCASNDGSIILTCTGGSPPFLYSGSVCGLGNFGPGTTNIFNNICSGTANFYITDGNGCTDTLQVNIADSCDLTWPGDANDDLIADNFDALEIGLGYGFTGQQRTGQGNNWNGYPSYTWGLSANGVTDDKHIDCDGNGIIDLSDTNAIVLNYGYTRPASRLGHMTKPEINGGNAILKVDILQDTIAAGTNGSITLSLGDAINPINNFYGIAFTLNFDSNIIDPNSFRMNSNGSWVGVQNSNLFCLILNDGTSGNAKAVVSRYNHTNINGHGLLGNIAFQTKTNYNGTQPLIISLSNVKLIDNANNQSSVITLNDSAIALNPILNLNNYTESYFTIYPNPFNSILNFKTKKNGFYTLKINNTLGETVMTSDFSSKEFNLNCSNLINGLYLYEIYTENQVLSRGKIMKN